MTQEYNNKEYDVCALGNAIVDVISTCSDQFLIDQKIAKGGMTLIERNRARDLTRLADNPDMVSGGSGANTITGVAACGGRTAFMGKVAKDALGKVFREDMIATGTAFRTSFYEGDELETARCHIFVSPDGERSMNTYLGCSVEFSPTDVDKDLIENSKITYLEGYLFDKEAAQKSFKSAAKFAQDSGSKVSMTLSDTFCVERHRDAFLGLLKNIDILFANEAEICALAQKDDIMEAIKSIQNDDMILAVTRSEKGAVIASKNGLIKVPTSPAQKVVDATGAGDQFAAGFLYGYTHGLSLEDSAILGNKMAGHIISIIGPRLQIDPKQFLTQNAA